MDGVTSSAEFSEIERQNVLTSDRKRNPGVETVVQKQLRLVVRRKLTYAYTELGEGGSVQQAINAMKDAIAVCERILAQE